MRSSSRVLALAIAVDSFVRLTSSFRRTGALRNASSQTWLNRALSPPVGISTRSPSRHQRAVASAASENGAIASISAASADANRSDTSARARSSTLSSRSEEHTSELQSLMRISYAVFCLKKKKQTTNARHPLYQQPNN